VCGLLSKPLTLFKTIICDFPYPIYDQTKYLITYLRPNPKINTLFQTCLIIGDLVQTDVEGIVKGFVDGLNDTDEKWLPLTKNRIQGKSAKIIPYLRSK